AGAWSALQHDLWQHWRRLPAACAAPALAVHLRRCRARAARAPHPATQVRAGADVDAPANGSGASAGAATGVDLTWTAHSHDMRVLAVVPSLYNTAPGQRFRMEQWAPRLRAHGIDVDFAPFEDLALHDLLYQRGRRLEKAIQIGRALARRVSVAADAR